MKIAAIMPELGFIVVPPEAPTLREDAKILTCYMPVCKVDGTAATEDERMIDDRMTRIDRPPSLTSIVTGQIRDLIVTGRLALGEALSEGMLSEQLGVSRAPVRAAFALLQSERLLEVRPQRGTFVFQYDNIDLREICELREVLEIGALRIAMAGRRHALIAALREQVSAAEAAHPGNAADYQPFDAAYHETLVRAADNSELVQAYTKISGRIRAIRFRLSQTMAQVTASQSHHQRIVIHLEAGEDDAARVLLSHHMYNSYRLFVRAVAQEQDSAVAQAS